jgi:predicted nucleic acid-binding protein
VIFVDSSFWIAVTLERDRWHDLARRLLELHWSAPLVTTHHVIGESWTFLRRRDGHRTAVRFLDFARASSRLRIERLTDDLEREASDWLRRHDEREYSFVDATSFAFMRSRRVRDALAFDGDFEAAGYRELRP